jgi:hypothetical protein
VSVDRSKYSDGPTFVTDEGFDVVCTVGRVTFGDAGEHPHVAAFRLIAEHGAPGEYRFPNEDGGVTVVTVEHQDVR